MPLTLRVFLALHEAVAMICEEFNLKAVDIPTGRWKTLGYEIPIVEPLIFQLTTKRPEDWSLGHYEVSLICPHSEKSLLTSTGDFCVQF